MDFLKSIIGECCIHILIQSISPYCHRQRYSTCPQWIQQFDILTLLNKPSYYRLTMWKYVGKKLSSRSKAPIHIILWNISIWRWWTGTSLTTLSISKMMSLWIRNSLNTYVNQNMGAFKMSCAFHGKYYVSTMLFAVIKMVLSDIRAVWSDIKKKLKTTKISHFKKDISKTNL